MRARHATRCLLLASALGLLTTLAVAWASWAWTDASQGRFEAIPPLSPGSAPPGPQMSVTRVRRLGATHWYFVHLSGSRERPDLSPLTPPWLLRRIESWSLAPGQLVETLAVEARGWPLPALWAEDLSTDGSAPNAAQQPPFRPIWRALFTDAALYALAWSVVLVAPPLIRSRSRTRRGACPRCGYDLTGAPGPCPECGAAPIPVRSARRGG